MGYQFTPEIRGDATFTGFGFDVDEDEQAVGDQLLPNKPQIVGSLVCKDEPDPAGVSSLTSKNLISGDAVITFDCSNMLTKRRVAGWWPRYGPEAPLTGTRTSWAAFARRLGPEFKGTRRPG